jgi:protein TonB
VTLTDLHPKQIDKDPVVPIGAPPSLVVLKTTTMFTPPVIVDDDRISDDELLKTQIELGESKGDISIATIVGDEEGIDIAFVKNYAPEIVEETSEPQVLIFAEEMPSFPGGEAELRKWLQDNIVYPTIALERGIQGRVSLRFVVTSDGTIDEVTVLKGLDPSCDKEAIRVVKKMPKWIPGKQNGNPAYVYFSLPVVFKINNN